VPSPAACTTGAMVVTRPAYVRDEVVVHSAAA
jgi:hypothetical protein